MGVVEAALHLRKTVVSFLSVLLFNEGETVSCLVGVDEVDDENHDGKAGEA